jgi:hypothetical protein
MTDATPRGRDPMSECLKAPFVWYGGKSRAAPLIWARLGNVPCFVEPFAGSLAVLLARPHAPHIESVNDKDAFIVNFFRALQSAPDEVAHWCDFPVNEAQQHAVHTWLVGQRETFTARLMGDPDSYDAQVAGRWCYGINTWIGSGWCSGQGAWQSVEDEEGHRQLVHLGNAGRGVHRQRVHLGNAGQGVHRQRVHLGDAGQGVHRQRVHLGNAGQGEGGLYAWFAALAERLRRVRVCCGDWQRVLGPSVTYKHGLCGILLDPPYSSEEDRTEDLYAVDDTQVAHAVRAWCLANGGHPLLRIVLCGYSNVHDELLSHGWTKEYWQANGGYGNQGNGKGRANAHREALWFSPACLAVPQLDLFAQEAP